MPEGIFRSPRTIAEEKNASKNFEEITESSYDAIGGHPTKDGPRSNQPRDWSADPTNPPEKKPEIK